MEKWLSMKELVRLSKLPETTIRRYINLFHEFVDTKEFGKHKKYAPDVAELMVRVAELYAQNMNTSEIHEVLHKERAIIVHLNTEPVQGGLTETTSNHVEIILKQNQVVVDSLHEVIMVQRTEIESLKQGMEHLQSELNKLKTTIQPKKKLWWKFW
jgi:hypothetical protein